MHCRPAGHHHYLKFVTHSWGPSQTKYIGGREEGGIFKLLNEMDQKDCRGLQQKTRPCLSTFYGLSDSMGSLHLHCL